MFAARKSHLYFLITTLLIILVVTAVLLSYADMKVLSFLAPIEKTFNNACERVRALYSSVQRLRSLDTENKRFRQEIIRLKNMIIEMEEHKIENERLRKMLIFKSGSDYVLLPAQIIGRDAHPIRNTITINKGSNDGIQRRMSVVVSEGLLGSVISVGKSLSSVMLLSDIDSRVAGISQKSRAQGIIEGSSTGKLYMKHVGRDADISVNDLVISSGMGGIFLKDLVIGRIQEILKDRQGILKEARIIPAVDFDRIEEVFVILAFE